MLRDPGIPAIDHFPSHLWPSLPEGWTKLLAPFPVASPSRHADAGICFRGSPDEDHYSDEMKTPLQVVTFTTPSPPAVLRTPCGVREVIGGERISALHMTSVNPLPSPRLWWSAPLYPCYFRRAMPIATLAYLYHTEYTSNTPKAYCVMLIYSN